MVLELEVRDPQRRGEVADRQLIGAIGREVVDHRDATAGAQRQPIHMEFLVAGNARAGRELHAHGLGVAVTQGLDRDLAGGGNVGVDESRGYLQHVGDVVEAIALIIRRQHLGAH